jgi:hypothetical protein
MVLPTVYLRLNVFAFGVNSIKHEPSPSFGTLKADEGNHALEHVVVVVIFINPVSSIVQAVPFVLDEVLYLSVTHSCFVSMAFIELSIEKCSAKNSHEEHEEGYDDTQFEYLG